MSQKKGYKDYVEDYSGSKSNMKLVYILAGLTVLTIALVVLLFVFLNSGDSESDDSANNSSNVSNTSTASAGESQTASADVSPTPTSNAGEEISVSIGVDVPQIPEGPAPTFAMGTDDKQGYVIIDNAVKNKGDLILVNFDSYQVDATYAPFSEANIYNESINVIKYPISVLNTSLTLERRALSALVELLKGAEASQYKFLVSKGYTKTETEIPDYKTGLSLDLSYKREDTSKKFGDLPQGQWVMENAYLYGFVQRYTAEKSSITGESNDNTNYRYVGFPHSYLMKSKNMCLEEYIDYLRRTKSVSVKKNEKLAYEVYYEYVDPQAADAKTAVKISDTAYNAYTQGLAKITVSGDNSYGGFIVTVIYN